MKIDFALFKNTRKEKENHPDWNIKSGDDYVGACWVKETRGGDKYLSCQIDDERNKQNKEDDII